MSIWSRLRSLFGEDDADISSDPAGDPAGDDAPKNDESAEAPVVRVNRDSDTEAAARLRIAQVERALRGAGEREGESSSAEPPWARGKNRPGRLPSGPGRPHDAAFVLTVVLDSELPSDAAALSACLDCSAWPTPSVRLIPLLRNGVTEPGYAAQLSAGEKRAFLVYRQTPYEPGGGKGHIGLLIGGPGDKKLEAGAQSDEEQLAPLVKALLVAQPDALGVVWNRHDKTFRPRDEALTALETPPSALEPAPA